MQKYKRLIILGRIGIEITDNINFSYWIYYITKNYMEVIDLKLLDKYTGEVVDKNIGTSEVEADFCNFLYPFRR